MTNDQQRILDIALRNFPFPQPNPGQIEAVVQGVIALLEGNQHVIIQAPTGVGKSEIATTIHKVMRELRPKHRTSITTATKALQDQYIASNRGTMVSLKGKSNYPCPIGKGPYNSGACRAAVATRYCNKHAQCPYVMQRKKWCDVADLRITNNSFQIEACPSICMMDENKADLIILDECHELDDAIIQHTSINLKADDFAFLRAWNINLQGTIRWYVRQFMTYEIGQPFVLTDELITGMNDLHGRVEEALESVNEMMKDKSRRDLEALGDAQEALQQICDKTDIFNEAGGDGQWIVNSVEDGSVELKPVFAWQVSNYSLFRKAPQFIHMSATICGVDEYAGGLGIEDYVFLDVPNPIPVASRRVFYVPCEKVSGPNIDYAKLSKAVDGLMGHFQGQNGIVHTVSYALADKVFQYSQKRSKMLITKDRDSVLDHLKRPVGNVVLSASLETGFDGKGDIARWQAIAKVPYLYLGDPMVKLHASARPRWYARKAVLRIVQAAGRVTRGITDHGTTFILDSNFERLLYENEDLFPDWFKDSIVKR